LSDSGILLRLHLQPSWRLAALIAGAHALAAGCVAAVSTSAPALALAALVVALGAASAWDRALLRGRHSPRSLEVGPEGRLEVRLADGTRIAVKDGARIVNRRLVALILRNPGRNSVLVVAGMLEPEEFRRLRLWALWGRMPRVAPAQLPG
jgi:hypothetical protein